ncbi:MAG: DNA methyltransferase, partial [Candidatus Moranbacteria bacterium]|nr:DNA methyltransferase [Candidatus Moranbacteria bacterium]
IFGKQNFKNEIVWKRTNSPKAQTNNFGTQHDIILFYTKSGNFLFKKIYGPFSNENLKPYSYEDHNGKFRLIEIVAAGIQKYEGRKEFEFMGVKAPWLYSKEKLNELWEKDLIYKTSTGSLKKKQYLKDMPGIIISDIWFDAEVKPLQGSSNESLNYPTQKPETLLERIIKASSKENDWILDPFCGCGTTVVAAEKLKINWVGIDITMLSINLVKHRLEKKFGLGVKQINVDGVPADLSGAKALFDKDHFEFEYWALDLVNAMPAQSKTKENMRGADKGVDGIVAPVKNIVNGENVYGKIIVQVKGGHVQRNQIATLKGDVEREKADGGVFITLEKPTGPMKSEAVDAGSFTVSFSKEEFPKIQIVTIEELLRGKKLNLPLGYSKSYYKEAKAVETENENQAKLL